MSPINRHPDVRRMLLTMNGLSAASRAICYACAHAADMSRLDPQRGTYWQARADMLTPVAKAFSTDAGLEVASLGIQVHGGLGYMEETGAAQHLRDARIASIYEGTNGIQAIDLVTRKLPVDGGAHVLGFIAELDALAEELSHQNRADFGRMGARLRASVNDLHGATEYLLTFLRSGRSEEALAGASPYLRLIGLTAGGCLLGKGALAAAQNTSPASAQHITAARFFAERLCPETAGLRMVVQEGADPLLGGQEAQAQ